MNAETKERLAKIRKWVATTNNFGWPEEVRWLCDQLEAADTRIAELDSELSTKAENYKAIVDDLLSDFECDPECDSFGHTETSAAYDTRNAFKKLRQQRDEARELLAELERQLAERGTFAEGVEALHKANTIIVKAQGILCEYLVPDGIDAKAAIIDLIELFDGPEQRNVQSAIHRALAPKEPPAMEPRCNCTKGSGGMQPAVCQVHSGEPYIRALYDECRYPALDALMQQLVDALVEAHESLHSEQCCGHERETCYEYTLRCSIQYNPALAAAAKLGYKPTGEASNG